MENLIKGLTEAQSILGQVGPNATPDVAVHPVRLVLGKFLAPVSVFVAACTLALSPIRDTLIEGFSHFVTSMTAPIASGWSGCRVGLAPTGKRRLCTAHAKLGNRVASIDHLVSVSEQ
jgi:hypothetical protein